MSRLRIARPPVSLIGGGLSTSRRLTAHVAVTAASTATRVVRGHSQLIVTGSHASGVSRYTAKTGYRSAMAWNSSTGAPWSTGMWGRAPTATLDVALQDRTSFTDRHLYEHPLGPGDAVEDHTTAGRASVAHPVAVAEHRHQVPPPCDVGHPERHSHQRAGAPPRHLERHPASGKQAERKGPPPEPGVPLRRLVATSARVHLAGALIADRPAGHRCHLPASTHRTARDDAQRYAASDDAVDSDRPADEPTGHRFDDQRETAVAVARRP